MRLAVALIIIALLAAAALASHQRKPFPLLVASAPVMPGVMVCQPMLVPGAEAPKQIVRT